MDSLGDWKKKVQENVDSVRGKIVEIATYIHDNPELGYEEHKACALLSSELAKNGFEVNKGVAGLPTAFRAILKGKTERPRVGILAEYDCLPGLGHGCGHNLSAASAAGAGIALGRLMPQLNGTLLIFGTPAEEGIVKNAGGKVVMIDEFRDLDAAMMIHAMDSNTVICNSFNREALEIEFIGKAANASNTEDASQGINALEAVMITWHAINSLRLLLKEEARIFGIITEGGISPNIVPDRAVTKMQIRVEDNDYFPEVVEKVKNAARGAALATGARVNFNTYAHTYQKMLNNFTLAETFEKNLAALGLQVEKLTRKGVATDMGNVSQVAPSIHPSIAIAPRGTPVHSVAFAKASASSRAHEAAVNAAKAFGRTAIDIFTNPELAKKIKDEFGQAQKK